jgi:hypothetical protein
MAAPCKIISLTISASHSSGVVSIPLIHFKLLSAGEGPSQIRTLMDMDMDVNSNNGNNGNINNNNSNNINNNDSNNNIDNEGSINELNNNSEDNSSKSDYFSLNLDLDSINMIGRDWLGCRDEMLSDDLNFMLFLLSFNFVDDSWHIHQIIQVNI